MLRLLLAALLFVKSPKDVESGPIREDKTAVQDDWFTRALKYMVSNPETLEELMTKKHALLEGDMILSTDRNAVESAWPTLEIPYMISPDLASRTDEILSAIAMVSEHTCVSFHKRISETNYLLFKPSKGCASYVGFIGGEQPVFVGPPCRMGNIVHEILHALGFHHEHTRTDREQYITVMSHNIMSGMERNFQKHKGQTFDLDYDISSIMHYGSGFFSANGLPTIVAHSDVKEMGQRVKMTKTDIEKVRHLYSCDTTTKGMNEESAAEKQQDSNVHNAMMLNDGSAPKTTNKGHVSVKKAEKTPTSTTASSSGSVQHQTTATRGQNNIGTEELD